MEKLPHGIIARHPEVEMPKYWGPMEKWDRSRNCYSDPNLKMVTERSKKGHYLHLWFPQEGDHRMLIQGDRSYGLGKLRDCWQRVLNGEATLIELQDPFETYTLLDLDWDIQYMRTHCSGFGWQERLQIASHKADPEITYLTLEKSKKRVNWILGSQVLQILIEDYEAGCAENDRDKRPNSISFSKRNEHYKNYYWPILDKKTLEKGEENISSLDLKFSDLFNE